MSSRSHIAFDASNTDTETDNEQPSMSMRSGAGRTPQKRNQTAVRGRSRGAIRGGYSRPAANESAVSNRSRTDHSRLQGSSSQSSSSEEEDEEGAGPSQRQASTSNAPAKRGRPRGGGSSAKARRQSEDSRAPQPGPSTRPSLGVTGARKRKAMVTRKVDREVWRLQTSTDLLIPRAPFGRLVKELLYSVRPNVEWRMQSEALQGLQEACEMYVVQFLEDAYRCCLHTNRVTLKPSDMVLVRTLRGAQL